MTGRRAWCSGCSRGPCARAASRPRTPRLLVSSSRLERPAPSRCQRLPPSGTASIRPRAHVYRCRLSDCTDTSRFRRGNGTPTCHDTRRPIGPGRGRPDRALSGPWPGGGAAPTALAPCAGQPLHERALPATRTPALHFGAHGGRGRCRHTLGKPWTTSPDDERRGVMESYPVSVGIPPFLRDFRGPTRVHDDEFDAAPAALPLDGAEDLLRTKERKDLRESSPVLLQPSLLPAEIEVLGDDRDAACGGKEGQQPRSVLDIVVSGTQVPAPSVEKTSVPRH